MTPYMSNVLKALVAENVGLIKSIASRHLDKVQMYVWQSISNGYDLAGLTKNLKHEYGVIQRRTARIASDQENKAHARNMRVLDGKSLALRRLFGCILMLGKTKTLTRCCTWKNL
jgi:hypothetical protein